jgi:nitrate/nitrite-specific signal transduction histidine kinase
VAEDPHLSPIRLRSLRLKIIAWSFIPTVVVLTAVAVIALFAYQDVTRDLVIGRNRELTRLAAGQLSIEIADYAEPLNAVGRTSGVSSGSALTQQQALKRAESRLAIFDGGVVVLNRYGVVTAAEPERPDAVGQDWSTHGYFREIVRSSGSVVSDIITDGPGGVPVIALSAPVTSPDGEFQGVITGMFRLGSRSVSAFYGSIVKLRVSNAGRSYLIDGKGRLIYHPDDSRIGQEARNEPVVRNALGGTVGAGRMIGIDGKDVVAGWAQVPGTPWGLIVEDGWLDLTGPSQGYSESLMLLLGLGVIVPAVVVWVGVRRITQPIDDLIVAARGLAAGDFGQRISARSGDEVEVLANQFNAMADELRASYAQLEERVAARTRELAALNDISAVVSESLDLEEVLQHALEKTLEVTSLKTGAAYRLASDGQSLVLVAHRGIRQEFVTTISEQTSDVATHVLVEGVPRPFALTVAEHTDPAMREMLLRQGLVQIIGVPLIAKGRLVGAIRLGTTEFRPISDEEKSLLASIGQQVGIAVENANLYEHAEESAAAAERNRLARDLHDAVTQTLFSASLIAEVLPRIWNRTPDEGARRLEELRQLTRGALAEMRTLLLELRPAVLVETPLGHLVKQLGEATTSRARIPVAVSVEGQCPVAPDVQVSLYRIVQEALNNVAKHSGASRAEVALRCAPGMVEVEIVDDGKGFDPEAIGPGHLGVGIMRERSQGIGAKVGISSRPGHGTRVAVCWRDPNAPADTRPMASDADD